MAIWAFIVQAAKAAAAAAKAAATKALTSIPKAIGLAKEPAKAIASKAAASTTAEAFKAAGGMASKPIANTALKAGTKLAPVANTANTGANASRFTSAQNLASMISGGDSGIAPAQDDFSPVYQQFGTDSGALASKGGSNTEISMSKNQEFTAKPDATKPTTDTKGKDWMGKIDQVIGTANQIKSMAPQQQSPFIYPDSYAAPANTGTAPVASPLMNSGREIDPFLLQMLQGKFTSPIGSQFPQGYYR